MSWGLRIYDEKGEITLSESGFGESGLKIDSLVEYKAVHAQPIPVYQYGYVTTDVACVFGYEWWWDVYISDWTNDKLVQVTQSKNVDNSATVLNLFASEDLDRIALAATKCLGTNGGGIDSQYQIAWPRTDAGVYKISYYSAYVSDRVDVIAGGGGGSTPDIAITSVFGDGQNTDGTQWVCYYWVDPNGNIVRCFSDHLGVLGKGTLGSVPSSADIFYGNAGGLAADRVSVSRTVTGLDSSKAHVVAYSTVDGISHFEIVRFQIDTSDFSTQKGTTVEDLRGPEVACNQLDQGRVIVFGFPHHAPINRSILYQAWNIDSSRNWVTTVPLQSRFSFSEDNKRAWWRMSVDISEDGHQKLYLIGTDGGFNQLYMIWFYRFSLTNAPFELLVDNLLL